MYFSIILINFQKNAEFDKPKRHISAMPLCKAHDNSFTYTANPTKRQIIILYYRPYWILYWILYSIPFCIPDYIPYFHVCINTFIVLLSYLLSGPYNAYTNNAFSQLLESSRSINNTLLKVKVTWKWIGSLS